MKKILIPFIASAMLAACTSEDFEQQAQGDKFNGQVTLTSEPYTFEDGVTRTALTNTGSSIEFAWKNGEAIGIFPIAPTTNNQAKQVLNVSGSATNATFDGAGWALLKGNTYAAYSPYNGTMPSETPYTAVPIDMTGQTQNGNNNLDHIGNGYDYMYATASVPSNGNVNFAFNHVGSIIMLELIMPESATWTNATLTAETDVFVTSATMNVSNGTLANKQFSNSISLDLDNESGKFLTLYLSALPTTTGSVALKVKKSNNEELSATLASKTLVAGHAYKWKYSWVHAPSGVEAVDLGLSVKWANMNIGATSATGYGNYYAWGEVEPQSSNIYSWSSYRFYNLSSDGSKSGIIKYTCPDNRKSSIWYDGDTFIGDNKTTLDPEDDAAAVNWGDSWRMPTHEEQTELVDNCYWVYTSSYNSSGIVGYIVYKAKNEGDKGKKIYKNNTPPSNYSLSDNHIFLPCGGSISDHAHVSVGTHGYYWSSSLDETSTQKARELFFYVSSGGVNSSKTSSRYIGHPVRAVCP